MHHGLPRPSFGAFSLAAVAITFWYAGTGPGLLTILLVSLAFSVFLFPITEVRGLGWQSFVAIYAMFSGLAGWFSASRRRAERRLAEARDNLEKRVAERTRELAQANQELRRSDDHLRLVIDTVPALIHTGRPDGYLDYFNRRWLDYVGLPLEEVAGWKWTNANHPEDAAVTVEKWGRSIATGEPFEHESRLRRADGEYRWMFHRKVPLRDDRGNIVKWYGSSVDIEDRKRAEEALTRSEQLYSKLVNSVDCIVWEADARTFQFSFVSPQAERILGYPVAQWKSPDFWVEHLHPDDREWCTALCKQAAEERRDHALEYRMVAADGRAVWLHDVVSAQMGPEGPVRLTGVMIDVTRRKLAETAAKESGERFRLVFERSTAGMMIAGASGEIIRANKAFCDFLGYSEDELKGRAILDVTHPEDAAKTLAYLEESQQHKMPCYDLEKRYVRKNGEIVWARASAIFLLPEGRPACWIAVVLDISERKRAEDDLRRQNEILQKIFDNAPVMIGFLAPDAKLSLANREWERTFGWTLEEMRAHDLDDLLAEFYPDPKLRQQAINFMSDRDSKFVDLSVRVRDGRTLETSWGKVRLSDGTEIYIGRDITERKGAEEALRESEQRYRNFISHSTEGVWRLELRRPLAVGLPEEESVAWLLQHGYIAECNDAFAQIVGFHRTEEVEGKRFGDLLPASDEERIESFRSAARGGWRSRTIEFRGRDQAGNLKYLLRTEIPIIENGKLARIWGLTRDLTERKRAEEALRDSEERLSLVASQLPAVVWSTDKELRITSHTGAGLRALGVEPNQLLGKTVDEYTLSFGPHPNRPDLRRALVGESLNYEVALKGRDCDVHVEPLRNASGEITGTVGIALDVTARRHAEVALRESEERFRTIFENAGVGMALVDLGGHPIKTNPALRQMLGYSEEEFSRMLFTEFTYAEDRQLDWRLYAELAAGKRDNYEIEKRYLKKDGGVLWGLLVVSLVKERQGRPMYCVGMVEDITERKLAEEALRESEQRYRMLFERNMAGVYRTTLDGRILECNQAMANILGFRSPQEAKESRGQDNYFSEQERTSFIERLETEGHLTNFEVLRRRNDGTPIWLLANISLITQAPSGQRILEGTFVDITERKRAEVDLQRSRDQLRALAVRLQNVREEERTRVAREIHDELGQALTAIKIDLSSLSHDVPVERKHRYESIMKLADETIQSVRRISTELRPAILDTSGLVAAVEWAAEEFEARTGIHCRLDLPQDEIFIDQDTATALFRILQETLTNVARHAHATEVSVRLAREVGNLNLEVHDNGKGVGEEQLSAADSLGILGMRERALLLGGELTITGAVGKGTTVIARIPEIRPILAKEDV